MRVVLQKLLNANLARAIIEQGYDQVGGIVVDASQVAGLRTAADIASAYGFAEAATFVDVVRFQVPPGSALTQPSDVAQRPWPTYPLGFLSSTELVPVWELSRTRYSPGAEYWRIDADGNQQLLSAYQGAAHGWRGARGWRPPTPLVGARARWGGGDFVADVAGSEVVLTRFDEAGDGGWAQVRPGAWTRQVPLDECEVFEVVYSATLSGVPVRVLATDGKVCHLQITGDPDAAQSLGAVMIEPGVFELAGVSVSNLADHQLVANEWTVS